MRALEGTSKSGKSSEFAPSKLDIPTQKLMSLIFDNDMFKEQMANFELGKYRAKTPSGLVYLGPDSHELWMHGL